MATSNSILPNNYLSPTINDNLNPINSNTAGYTGINTNPNYTSLGDTVGLPGPEAGGGTMDFLFGKDGKGGNLIPGLEALSGLAGAYTGYKSLNLGEDYLDFTKNQYNRELLNQGSVYNNTIRDSQNIRLKATNAYDTTTPEGAAAHHEQDTDIR